MKLLDNNSKGKLYAIISAFSFAASAPLGKFIRAEFSVLNLLFWRYLVASCVISFAVYIYRKELKFDKKVILKAFITAAIFYSGSSALYFMSFDYIGTGLSSAICFSHSLFVTIYLWIFDKQKITKVYCASFIIIVIGLSLIVNTKTGHQDYAKGISFAILSAITYSIYIFLNRNKSSSLTPVLSSAMLFYANMIIYLVTAFSDNSLAMPTNSSMWIKVLALGIICTALPIFFLLKALQNTSASDVTILSVLRPVFVMLMGAVLFGETLSIYQAFGITLIFAGGVIINLQKKPAIKSN
jgi:drug/metabolite transporter (DMT)-like permease